MTCFEAYQRNVDKESVISVESNKYSVPSDYVGKIVWVKKYSDTIVVFDTDSKDTPKQFIDLLLWARDNNHSFQDLCSSVQVAGRKEYVYNFRSDIALEFLLLSANPKEVHDFIYNHEDSKPKDYPMSDTSLMDALFKNITNIQTNEDHP